MKGLYVALVALGFVLGAVVVVFADTGPDRGTAATAAVATPAGTATPGADGHDHSTKAAAGDTPCEQAAPVPSVGDIEGDHGHRGAVPQTPLTEAERILLAEQQVQARAVADQFPTVADAEAGGYRQSTSFLPCIGAHYTNFALARAFDPARPSELLFDGTTPDAKIIGLSYLVYNPGGPPEGFAGPNDVWHTHSRNGGLCIKGIVIGDEDMSKEQCESLGGRKVGLKDVYMVHDWVVPGWECSWGVFAGECPELGGKEGQDAFS